MRSQILGFFALLNAIAFPGWDEKCDRTTEKEEIIQSDRAIAKIKVL
ncbi:MULTISPECIES: hypothetical protein [Spirulina sp. CCY15215]|nr:hypothetical protein [Spirulina major]